MGSNGAVFVDLDGDSLLDLFVGAVFEQAPAIYQNLGEGEFRELSSSGLDYTDPLHTWGTAFADYDGDGDLDLVAAHWHEEPVGGSPGWLWQNDGQGSFSDRSYVAGFADRLLGRADLSFTPTLVDLNDDLLPDALVAGDLGTSSVFLNQGDGTFDDVTSADITDENGMGSAVGDFDNDGRLDWFVTSIWDPDGVAESGWGVTGNRLYRGLGNGAFVDVTESAGVRAGYWGWGACFADFNNDGWLDLFHVNGADFVDLASSDADEGMEAFRSDPVRLFMNTRNGSFVERSEELGLRDRGIGTATACVDYDRDGDVDILIGNVDSALRLYRNNAPVGRFLRVTLQGKPPNHDAVGARVEVETGEITQTRVVLAGAAFLSQVPFEALFGLGDAMVRRVTVRWPDGSVTVLDDPPADGDLRLLHPGAAGDR